MHSRRSLIPPKSSGFHAGGLSDRWLELMQTLHLAGERRELIGLAATIPALRHCPPAFLTFDSYPEERIEYTDRVLQAKFKGKTTDFCL